MSRKSDGLVRDEKSSYYDMGGLSLVSIWKAKLTIEERKGLFKGTALKYIVRAGNKKGEAAAKDIRKAINYLRNLLATLEEEEGEVNDGTSC